MGLFSGIANIVDTVTGGFFSDQSGKFQQDDANKAAMTSWNLANDYNHPVNQMERLKAAGLNPNLVYGSGSVTGNTTSAPSLVGGGYGNSTQNLMTGVKNTLGLVQDGANLNATFAQARASNSAAAASGAQAANLGAQTAINETRSKYEEKSLLADLDYKQALAAKTKAETKKTKAEASIAQGEADIFGSVGGAKGASGLGKAAKFVGNVARGIFK